MSIQTLALEQTKGPKESSILENHSMEQHTAINVRGAAVVPEVPVGDLLRCMGDVTLTTLNGIRIEAERSTSALSSVVTVDLNSTSIYYRRRRLGKKLYVGKAREHPPPAALEKRWQENILPRLIQDLKQIIDQQLPNLASEDTNVECELYMAGYSKGKSKAVDLKPTVWLCCGSKKCERVMRREVEFLTYLNSFAQGSVEISDGLRLAAATGCEIPDFEDVDISEPGFPTTDGHAVHIHFQRPWTGTSACGLRCLITYTKDGAIVGQRKSTIGGLLRVGHSIYGVTTAHGMLNTPNIPPNKPGEDHASEDTLSDSDSDEQYSCSSEDDEVTYIHGKKPTLRSDGGPRPRRLAALSLDESYMRWDKIASCGPTFLNGSGSTNGPTPELKIPASTADYSLIDLGFRADFKLFNSYRGDPGISTSRIFSFSNDENLPQGAVSIIASHGRSIEGYLLPGTSTYVSRDAVISTRKIQLGIPLAQGISGAWVARDGILCGMIVAIYRHDPYAHMLTAKTLISDIRHTNSYNELEQIRVATTMDFNALFPVTTETPTLNPAKPMSANKHSATFQSANYFGPTIARVVAGVGLAVPVLVAGAGVAVAAMSAQSQQSQASSKKLSKDQSAELNDNREPTKTIQETQ